MITSLGIRRLVHHRQHHRSLAARLCNNNQTSGCCQCAPPHLAHVSHRDAVVPSPNYRFVHATCSSHLNTTGALLSNYVGAGGNGATNTFQGAAASTAMNDDCEDDDLYCNDRNPALVTKPDDDDFGDHDESELQEWHRRKEEEFHQLSSVTEEALKIPVQNHGCDFDSILSLMQQWNTFVSSITSEIYTLSDFRRNNQQYPPSRFMKSITHDSAEKVESLLIHLLGAGALLTPKMEVNAYKLSMDVWPHVFHSQSGDRCENVLEQYGERYGGDMNYMPTLDSYKTVLKAHLKSCSSYSQSNEGESPGKKALGVLTLLDNVYTRGDMFLKPDVELYSLTIASIRNTLLDWQSRRRFQKNFRPLEEDLGTRLLEALEKMALSLEEVMESKKVDERPSLQQWHFAISAYADGLATAASIPIGEDGKITDSLLMKLEHLLATNSDRIVNSIDDEDSNDIHTKKFTEEIQKNVEASYSSAISAGLILSKEDGHFPDFSSALNNATSSEEMFLRMKHQSQESLPDRNFLFPLPTPENYRALVQCWCECVKKGYSTKSANEIMATLDKLPHLKAHSLLKRLEKQMAARPMEGSIYADVIWAWGQVLYWPAIYRVNDYFFAANAMGVLLKRAISHYEHGSVFFSHPPSVTNMHNNLLLLHSKAFKSREDAMIRSLKVLDQMEHISKLSEGAIAQPNAFTFSLILKTIALSGALSSASKAEAVIRKMEDFGLKPSERHYIGLMKAHSRDVQKGDSDPKKVELILRHVKGKYRENKSVKPTAAMYTVCITAYGASKNYNSVSAVLGLFEEVVRLYKETNDKDFQPDSMLYGSVIGAISKAKLKNNASLRHAITFLNRMEKSHDSGEIEEGPNRYAYTNLLHAISQSRVGDGALLAENLMERMDSRSKKWDDESIRPDTHAYTTLIQIFSRSKDPEAVHRAQTWFQQMETRYNDGDSRAKPNKVTCTALINCWRSSNITQAGEEAENILSMMETKYENGDLDLKPDAFVYASTIDAWARSNSHDKAERAWSIYQRMKKQYLNGNMESKPNNVIMTSIIKACGYTFGGREDKQRALKVLLECMAELKSREYIDPNPICYRASLNALKALVIDDARRCAISAAIFEACCRNGKLDKTVLESLQNVQPELYEKLPRSIPSKWECNVSTGHNT